MTDRTFLTFAAALSASVLLVACGARPPAEVADHPPAAEAEAEAPSPPADAAPAEPPATHELALAEKGARATDHGLMVGLDSADFPVGGTSFEPKDDTRIRHVVALLEERPELRVEILGYTDDRGSHEANARISEQRAESVRARLVDEEGVDPDRIDVTGMGAADPIASNESADGRALNRRVELRLVDPTGGFSSRIASADSSAGMQ